MLTHRQSPLSRRAFLKGGALLAAGAALAGGYRDMGVNSVAGEIVSEAISVAVPGLPRAFNGYRIGFFTDIHLGIWVPDEWVAWGIEKLRSAKPNILVLGGDYILANDNPLWPMLGWVRNEAYAGMDSEDAVPRIFSSAAKLLASYAPPDGIVGVVGNHERWNSFELFQQAFREYPEIRILVNNEVEVRRSDQSLFFFGVDDFLTGIPLPLPPRTIEGRAARVLVSHNPDYVSAALRAGQADFQLALCGHTHGGQIRVPGLISLAAPVQDQRFLAGLVPADGRHVYTSRGLGVVGLPFRVNCPPEVTVIELQTT